MFTIIFDLQTVCLLLWFAELWWHKHIFSEEILSWVRSTRLLLAQSVQHRLEIGCFMGFSDTCALISELFFRTHNFSSLLSARWTRRYFQQIGITWPHHLNYFFVSLFSLFDSISHWVWVSLQYSILKMQQLSDLKLCPLSYLWTFQTLNWKQLRLIVGNPVDRCTLISRSNLERRLLANLVGESHRLVLAVLVLDVHFWENRIVSVRFD